MKNTPKIDVTNLGDSPEIFMDGFQRVLYQAGLENVDRQKVQDEWDDAVSRQMSKKLSRASKVIISSWDFIKVLFSLKPGQSIVVDYDGNIFRGRLNTDKFEKLPQKFSIGRHDHSVDSGLHDSAMRTSSSVSSPSPAFKNSWNKIHAKAVSDKSSKQVPMDVSIIFWNMEFYTPDEIIVEKVTTGPLAHKFTEITAKELPNVSLGISSLGSLRYYRRNGEIFWLDGE